MSDILEIRTAVSELSRTRVTAYIELVKLRIGAMVLLATGVGFYLAWPGPMSITAAVILIHTLLGTGLVASGANALNQYMEVEFDRQMLRTQNRPLPSKRLTPIEVLTFSVAIAVVGAAYLALMVNPLCATLSAFTFVVYAFFYTPLKRVTSLSVVVGAIPGAMPPVIGWAAGMGALNFETWLLFGILFFWQMPHFAAIAWQYRADYARAGYPMLPVIDPEGTRLKLHVMTHTVGLISASLLPALYGVTGAIYGIAAMLLGFSFLISGIRFVTCKTTEAARFHVIASVIYLPLLLTLMIIDKV